MGVKAAFVEIETFDAFMLRLWRNIEDKEPLIDAKVRKSVQTSVAIPIPQAGKGAIGRLNALPVLSLPGECQAITFRSDKEWGDLRAATAATEGKLIFTGDFGCRRSDTSVLDADMLQDPLMPRGRVVLKPVTIDLDSVDRRAVEEMRRVMKLRGRLARIRAVGGATDLSLGEWLVHVGRAGATIEIKEPRSWSDDRGSLLTRTRKQTIGLLWLLKT